MNETDIFSENFTNQFQIAIDVNKSCCVCFAELYYINKRNCENVLDLLDLERVYFKNNVIPDEILVLSCCKVHYICIGCMRKLINNYENHVINESNSHFSCPYPFQECVTEIGFKNVFDHNSIKKICISETEWNNYMTQAERFAFPGFTILKCPLYIYKRGVQSRCNTKVLVDNNLIKTVTIGELIVECSQNENCLKKFCFSCKQLINYYQKICYECKTSYENENPNVYNYYFNKEVGDKNILWGFDEQESDNIFDNEEFEYLYLNKDITVEIATKQILLAIRDTQNHMICGICKISLYKTERCNGLSHHNLERCYACSRIGYPIKGLDDHWGLGGVDGCFRFDHDTFVKQNVPEYICNDNLCSNHEKGDCTIDEHQCGIVKLNLFRKRGYVYHMLKSLLSDIKFQVYDNLYNICKDDPLLLELLPYKQTLILLNEFRKQYRNYCEDIVYKQLHCKNVAEIFTNKNEFVSASEYVQTYYTLPSNDVVVKGIATSTDHFLENYDENDTILTDTNSELQVDTRSVDITDIDYRNINYPDINYSRISYPDTEPEENVLNWIRYGERDSDHLTRLLDLLQDQLFQNLEEELNDN
jgi:hypothetical protein